jgi:hypothetical protein
VPLKVIRLAAELNVRLFVKFPVRESGCDIVAVPLLEKFPPKINPVADIFIVPLLMIDPVTPFIFAPVLNVPEFTFTVPSKIIL